MSAKKNKIDIEDAINRISWRFKNDNIKINESKIIINEKDIEAVDFLVDWVNRQKKQELQENVLFAKIFVYIFDNLILHYDCPQQALNKLQEIAKRPIQEYYENVFKDLNMIEQIKFLKSININTDKHFALKSGIENQEELSKLKDNEKEFLEKVKGTWKIEQVYKSLNNTITEFINRYKNLP